MKETKIPRIGVGVVVVKSGLVLLGKRKGSHGAGTWSLSGGHLEYGETIEECAKRELAEETGLQALQIELGPWSNDIINKDKHYVTIFTFVKKFQGDVKLLEPSKCEGWNWFKWDQLPSPLFLPVESLIKKMGIEKLKSI
ncbi:MAG TPA: NUDIX domain-containing protein [Chlamydiales bacterium]|nr:NUDIX domain-containing protein [Chlamydiales bacterium]